MTYAGGSSEAWFPSPVNALFAFASDLTGDPEGEYRRLIEVFDECGVAFVSRHEDVPGPITALCVVGRGCWLYTGRYGRASDARWGRARMLAAHDEILFFVGAMSNAAFHIHAGKSGSDPAAALGGGIGIMIMDGTTFEEVPRR
jgi:hypothetical protein